MNFFAFLARLFRRSPPRPSPEAPIIPPAAPTYWLTVLDVKKVISSYDLSSKVIRIQLSDPVVGAWIRLMLPSGEISPITKCPAGDFLGLGGNSAHELAFNYLAGCKIQVADDPQGVWRTVAFT